MYVFRYYLTYVLYVHTDWALWVCWVQFIFTHDIYASLSYLQQGIVDVAFMPDYIIPDIPPFVWDQMGINISNFRVLGQTVS